MELVTEPDIYSPGIDNVGNYVDRIPAFNEQGRGIRCPCGSRKDKTYESSMSFSTHIKSKTHQKWLHDLTLNKTNYYVENEALKTTIHTQKIIIAKLEIDLKIKNTTIDCLAKQLASSKIVVGDLLNFD